MTPRHFAKSSRRPGRGLALLLTSVSLSAGLALGQTPSTVPMVPMLPAPGLPATALAAPTDGPGAAKAGPNDNAAAASTKTENAKTAAANDSAPATLPKAELPKAELPKAELPKAELPKAELPKAELPKAEAPSRPIHDPHVKKAQCCGGLLGPLLSGGSGGCANGSCGSGGCANGQCVPGRKACAWCNDDTAWGRFVGGVYTCICCPDPCYEPRWLDEANAAFFQDGARPVTQTRIRYDAAINYRFPDTAEFLWAKKGGKGPPKAEDNVDIDELTLYQETAAGNFSFFVEMPYRLVDPAVNEFHAGFADINLGTKSLLLDCELLQMAFQFRTYIPSGNFRRGLGTGHVSLEPSLLTTIKLTPTTYLQTQLAEWIPLGGDPDGEGAALRYCFSFDQVLWRAHNDGCMLIGTFEMNGVTFQEGQFTRPDGTVEGASGHNIFLIGPGIRFSMCHKLDLGIGAGFSLCDHGPEQLYRVEFRYRF